MQPRLSTNEKARLRPWRRRRESDLSDADHLPDVLLHRCLWHRAPASPERLFSSRAVLDAFNDPIIGAIADRTNSRWGRYRPWIAVDGRPAGRSAGALLLVAAFRADRKNRLGHRDLQPAHGHCTPRTTFPTPRLSGVMTGGFGRTHKPCVLAIRVRDGGRAGRQHVHLKLVAMFGKGDASVGYQLTMALWAVLAVTFFASHSRSRENASHQIPGNDRRVAGLDRFTTQQTVDRALCARRSDLYPTRDARRRDAVLLQSLSHCARHFRLDQITSAYSMAWVSSSPSSASHSRNRSFCDLESGPHFEPACSCPRC